MFPIKLFCSLKTLWPLIVFYRSILCNPIVKTLSENLRDYAVKENVSSTAALTLQNIEEYKHAAALANAHNNDKFKEIPDTDNTISGSSYTRGLLHQDHAASGGFSPTEFIEHPVPPQFGYEFGYHLPDEHLFSIPEYHHGGHGHHFGHHGHRHKFAHDIATKAVLLPIAGLALLGAAAALVTNPILLQLGVISGKRRRRDTEEIMTAPDHINGFHHNYNPYDVKKSDIRNEKRVQKSSFQGQNNVLNARTKMPTKYARKPLKRIFNSKGAFNKIPSTEKTTIASVTLAADYDGKFDNDDGFVPVPLKKKIN